MVKKQHIKAGRFTPTEMLDMSGYKGQMVVDKKGDKIGFFAEVPGAGVSRYINCDFLEIQKDDYDKDVLVGQNCAMIDCEPSASNLQRCGRPEDLAQSKKGVTTFKNIKLDDYRPADDLFGDEKEVFKQLTEFL